MGKLFELHIARRQDLDQLTELQGVYWDETKPPCYILRATEGAARQLIHKCKAIGATEYIPSKEPNGEYKIDPKKFRMAVRDVFNDDIGPRKFAEAAVSAEESIWVWV